MSDEDREWQFAQRQIAYRQSANWRRSLTEAGIFLGTAIVVVAILF